MHMSDEVVVFYQILIQITSRMQLVDISDVLPDLKRHSGLSSWNVFDEEISNVDMSRFVST